MSVQLCLRERVGWEGVGCREGDVGGGGGGMDWVGLLEDGVEGLFFFPLELCFEMARSRLVEKGQRSEWPVHRRSQTLSVVTRS